MGSCSEAVEELIRAVLSRSKRVAFSLSRSWKSFRHVKKIHRGCFLTNKSVSVKLCSTFWISSLWISNSCNSCLCFLRSSMISTSSWFARPPKVSASSLAARYSCLFSAALCLSFSSDLLNWLCSALRHESWIGKPGKLEFREQTVILMKNSVKDHRKPEPQEHWSLIRFERGVHSQSALALQLWQL